MDHHQRITLRRLNDAGEQHRPDGSQAEVGGLVGTGEIVVTPLDHVKAVSEKTEVRVRHREPAAKKPSGRLSRRAASF